MRKARGGGSDGGGGSGPKLPGNAPSGPGGPLGPEAPSGVPMPGNGPLVPLDPMAEIGSSGLSAFGGIITDDVLRELDGVRGVRTFKEMSYTESTLVGLLFVIEMLMRRVPWRVDPAEAPQEDADFLEECKDDMSSTWADTIAEIDSFLPYGWAYHEVVYKYRRGNSLVGEEQSQYDDNKIGWRKLPLRAQDTLYRWELDPNGGVRGMIQSAPPTYTPTFIPIQKALLFRTSIFKGNPQGKSILYGSYKPWYLKKHIENIEAIGIERDLTGLPVLWVPQQYLDTSSTDPVVVQTRARFYDTLRRVKRDQHEGLMLPLVYDEKGNKLYDFTLQTTGGRRQFDTNQIVARLDRAMARTVIADFLMLGETNTGSFALSKNKTDLFVEAIAAWQDMIAEVFNRHAVPKLFRLNGKQLGPYPEFRHGKIRAIDLAEIGKFLADLTAAGAEVFPNIELLKDLFEEAGLPPVIEGEQPGAVAGDQPMDIAPSPLPGTPPEVQYPDEGGAVLPGGPKGSNL